MTPGGLPVWRSVMFVPTNVDKFVDKAHLRGADAILLDLEDSIATSEKETARRALPEAIKKVARGGGDIGVRINRPLDLAVRDIEASVRPEISFLSLPKVAGALHVQLLSELVTDLERKRGLAEGSVRFIANVETAAALSKLEEVARADKRVIALVLGGEDFALSCEMEPSGEALLVPKQLAVFAARGAGILPMGLIGTVANFSDMAAFRAIARRARTLGYAGAYAIHPAQVQILNEEFTPSAESVAKAQAIVAAARSAEKDGIGSFGFEGKMIDKPIIDRAERLIERAAAIAARGQAPAGGRDSSP